MQNIMNQHVIIDYKLNGPFRKDVSFMVPPKQAAEEKQSDNNYTEWLQKRKHFRHDIENMGLSEKWLTNKPRKTVLEKRVLARMIAASTPQPCAAWVRNVTDNQYVFILYYYLFNIAPVCLIRF